jgi:hypothetical protein
MGSDHELTERRTDIQWPEVGCTRNCDSILLPATLMTQIGASGITAAETIHLDTESVSKTLGNRADLRLAAELQQLLRRSRLVC